MTRRSYTGAAVATTLASPLASSDTTGTLAATANLPTSNFVVTVDQGLAGEEKILIGTRTGTSVSGLVRGFDGTLAASHVAGATVLHTISATDLDEANAHVNLPVDTSPSNIHHTLGTGSNQAAAGDHTHVSTAPVIQAGSNTITITSANSGTKSVTFPSAFTGTPTVFITLTTSTLSTDFPAISVTAKSTTGFTVQFANAASSGATKTGTYTFDWLALV